MVNKTYKSKEWIVMWQALIKLVEKWACRHEWEKIDEWTETDQYRNSISSYDYALYVCKKCGKFKKV